MKKWKNKWLAVILSILLIFSGNVSIFAEAKEPEAAMTEVIDKPESSIFPTEHQVETSTEESGKEGTVDDSEETENTTAEDHPQMQEDSIDETEHSYGKETTEEKNAGPLSFTFADDDLSSYTVKEMVKKDDGSFVQ